MRKGILAVATICLSTTIHASLIQGSMTEYNTQVNFDLTALGTSDWAYWDTDADPASGVAANEMSGAGLIGSITDESGGSLIRGSLSLVRPYSGFSFSNGTSPSSGTISSPNPTGLLNQNLNQVGKGLSLDITLPTTNTYTVMIWGAVDLGSATFVASLNNAVSYTNTVLSETSGNKNTGVYTLTVTPDQANDILNIKYTLKSGGNAVSHVDLQAATIAIPEPVTATLISLSGASLLFIRRFFS